MTYTTMPINLECGSLNSHLLRLAEDLAERFQARALGFTACRPMHILTGDIYKDSKILLRDHVEIDREIAAARAAFRDALCGRTELPDWRSIVTFQPIAHSLAAEARRADLILTSASPRRWGEASCAIDLNSFVMQAGRPVSSCHPDARRVTSAA